MEKEMKSTSAWETYYGTPPPWVMMLYITCRTLLVVALIIGSNTPKIIILLAWHTMNRSCIQVLNLLVGKPIAVQNIKAYMYVGNSLYSLKP